MKSIFFLILLFITGNIFGQSWNTITGKSSYTDSARYLKYRGANNNDSVLMIHPTTGVLMKTLKGLTPSLGIDSITLYGNQLCQWQAGTATCYFLEPSSGGAVDSFHLSPDSLAIYQYRNGMFIDSIYLLHTYLYVDNSHFSLTPNYLGNPYAQLLNATGLVDSVYASPFGSGFDYIRYANGDVDSIPAGGSSTVAIQWSVLDSLSTPSVTPSDGGKYLVGTSPTGDFTGHANEIATYNLAGLNYTFQSPTIGDLLYNAGNTLVSQWTGSAWIRVSKLLWHQGGEDASYGNVVGGSKGDFSTILKTRDTTRLEISNTGISTFANGIVNGNYIKIDPESSGLSPNIKMRYQGSLEMTIGANSLGGRIATNVGLDANGALRSVGLISATTVLAGNPLTLNPAGGSLILMPTGAPAFINFTNNTAFNSGALGTQTATGDLTYYTTPTATQNFDGTEAWRTVRSTNDFLIGTPTDVTNSLLTVKSTSKGVLFTPMTAAQRLAISTPATGLMVFDTDSACYFNYTGAAWVSLCRTGSGGSGTALANFYLKDSVFSSDRIAHLNNHTLAFRGGNVGIGATPTDYFQVIDSLSNNVLFEVSPSLLHTYMYSTDGTTSGIVATVSDGVNSNVRTYINSGNGVTNAEVSADGFNNSVTLRTSDGITPTGNIFFQDSSQMLASNNDVWTLLDATTGRGAWQPSGGGGGNTIYTGDGTVAGDRTVDLDGHNLIFAWGGTTTFSPSDGAFVVVSPLSKLLQVSDADDDLLLQYNGSNKLEINSTGTHITGNVLYDSPPTGVSTDSILTWDATTKVVNKRPSSSFGSGTVTNVAALTLGTTGTDLSSSVANSTTTPVITLNVPTASASNRGALSSTDWSTFNSKQATISVTSPITLTGASVGMVNQGTTSTVLHGNASGNPSFGAIVNADITNSTIDLTAKVTGVLPIANGGTGSATTSQNFALIGPTSGSGAYSFRALVAGDIPSLSGSYLPLTGGILTLPVTTGTGTTAGLQAMANSLTTGNGVDISSSSITTGNLMKLTSTATVGNGFSLSNINSSGANGTASKTVTGETISVTNTGTTSTNVGLNVTASGATNNYAALFTGSVGIGTSTPSAPLEINVSASHNILFGRDASFSTVPAISMNGTLSDAGMAGFFADDAGGGNQNFYINAPKRIILRPAGSGTNTQFVFGSNSFFGIGVGDYNADPVYPLDIAFTRAAGEMVRVKNTSSTGFSNIFMQDNSGVSRMSVGYANSGAATYPGLSFINSQNSANLIFGTDGTEKVRISGSNGNVGVGVTAPTSILHTTSFATAYRAITALRTLDATDYTIECTANTFTVTLPTAVGISGRIYVVTNSGTGVTTVGTTSSQTFVNVVATPTTLTLAQFGTATVQSNGANWLRLTNL